MRAPSTDLPLRLEDVGVVAGAVTILDNVTLEIAAGRPTALIGPNGSGKSTLLRIAMGLIAPTRGRVTWAGRETVAPDRRAMMFQRPVLLRRSVEANLHYALAAASVPRAERSRRAAQLLELAGLSAFAQRPARRLSGGEQQKLALVRALARDPELLFLDEPGASLDPGAAKALEDNIRAIAERGIKVVIATHDLAQARRLAGDVVFLHRGRVVETGSAEEFFAEPRTQDARRFVAGELLA